MKNVFFCLLIISLLSSCLEKFNPKDIENTRWELKELPGLKLPENTKATLNFGDSLKLSGKSFCNSYGGQAVADKESITLKNIYGTKMFCQDSDAAERAYLQAMNQVNMAKVSGDELQLFHGTKKLLVFNRVN
ncbi:META domain-containing protein [Pedobacter sandarakinus]|uniref:META domain-containing protein n=1 Tax=Pedobacter sandarakinus TaxID=353156 RepID=UPI00224718A6|nr:META domain-containing protein [Pedobacter sandarakinus]MCX2575545.1 META domain-containing protein [Pedobacter sandarakinus]